MVRRVGLCRTNRLQYAELHQGFTSLHRAERENGITAHHKRVNQRILLQPLEKPPQSKEKRSIKQQPFKQTFTGIV